MRRGWAPARCCRCQTRLHGARAQVTEFLDTGKLAVLEAVGGLRKPGEDAPAVEPTADAAMAMKFV